MLLMSHISRRLRNVLPSFFFCVYKPYALGCVLIDMSCKWISKHGIGNFVVNGMIWSRKLGGWGGGLLQMTIPSSP